MLPSLLGPTQGYANVYGVATAHYLLATDIY